LSHYGWQGVLFLGGVLPLALVPLLIILLPESLRFLLLKQRPLGQVESIQRALDPQTTTPPHLSAREAATRTPIGELFKPPYAVGTALLWMSFFMSLLIIYLISSWLPTLLTGAGADLRTASLVTSVFQIGGTVGAILLGRLMDGVGAARTLSVAYATGAGFVLLCGASSTNLGMLVLAVFGVGFCISGSQVGANALAAAYYPTSSRATGVSWANAAGRTGSVVGSVSGGWLVSVGFDAAGILAMLAVPALIASLGIALLGRHDTVRRAAAAA